MIMSRHPPEQNYPGFQRFSNISGWFKKTLICASIFIGAYWLIRALLTEIGAVNADVLIYETVSRGILNGIQPYTGLYESKPPLVFFLHMIPQKLLTFLQVGMFASIPFLLRKKETFVLLVPLVLLLHPHAGSLQTEGFGVFFAILYIVFYGNIFASSIAIFLSVALKEPFIFSVLASGLFLSKTPTDFVRKFCIPLGIALCIGAFGLLVTGLLEPYFTVYIPAMGMRVAGDPLWTRLLSFRILFARVTEYSTLPITGYIIMAGFLVSRTKRIFFEKMFLVGMVHFSYVLFLWIMVLKRIGFSDYSDPWFLCIFLVYIAGCVGILLFVRTWASITAVLAFSLATLSIGIAGYSPQHLAFAIPFFFVGIKNLSETKFLYLAMILSAIGLVFYTTNPRDVEHRLSKLSQSYEVFQEDTDKYDEMMERCGYARFAYIGGSAPLLGYSRFSPTGPLFNVAQSYLGTDHPLVQATIRNAKQAPLLVHTDAIYDSPFDGLLEHFTGPVPDCAKGYEFEKFEVRFP